MPDARRARGRQSRRQSNAAVLETQLRQLVDANAPERTEAERALACKKLLAVANDLTPTYIVGPDRRREPLGVRDAKKELRTLHLAIGRAAAMADALTTQASLLLLEHSNRPIGIWRATLREMTAQTKAAMDARSFHADEQRLRTVLAMETAKILYEDLGIAISQDRVRVDAPSTQAPFARILTVLLEMAGISPDLNRTMKAALALLVDPLGDRAD